MCQIKTQANRMLIFHPSAADDQRSDAYHGYWAEAFKGFPFWDEYSRRIPTWIMRLFCSPTKNFQIYSTTIFPVCGRTCTILYIAINDHVHGKVRLQSKWFRMVYSTYDFTAAVQCIDHQSPIDQCLHSMKNSLNVIRRPYHFVTLITLIEHFLGIYLKKRSSNSSPFLLFLMTCNVVVSKRKSYVIYVILCVWHKISTLTITAKRFVHLNNRNITEWHALCIKFNYQSNNNNKTIKNL